MTYFHDRHSRRVDAWVTPGDDDLDDDLNTIAASDGPPDAIGKLTASPLATSARAFHRRLDEAQERDPASARPDPDLWDRILADVGSHRKDNTMSSIPLSSGANPAPFGSGAARSTTPLHSPRHSRLGRWANALAAVSLVLLLGVGYWFSGYGPGGPGGGGNPQYAAQGVSPSSSPDASAIGCNVEPLTTDEIVALVENPYSIMPRDVFGTPTPGEEGHSITEGLVEPDPMISVLIASRSGGIVPSESDFEAAYSVADQYYACQALGTNAQVWALTDAASLQHLVLSGFPVYRNETQVRELVEKIKDEPASSPEGSLLIDQSADGRAVYANSNIQDARVFDVGKGGWMLNDADKLMYIGEEYRDENESVVSVTDWDATALVGGEEHSNSTSLILVHSKSTDRWFVLSGNAPRG